MNKILSLILVSALVISATAGTGQNVVEILKGFASGLNHADLNPAIQNCSNSIDATYESFVNFTSFRHGLDNETQFEQTTASLMVNWVHTIRVCVNVSENVASFFNTLENEISRFSTSELSNRLFTNMFAINMKIMQVKSSIEAKNFKAAGEAISEAFKIVVYGSVDGPKKTIRQLSTFTSSASDAVNVNATFLGFLGFFEEANTTVNITHYVQFANDSSALIQLANTLEVAVQKMDIMTIMACLQSMTGAFQDASRDFTVLNTEVTQLIQRDLPLFNTPEKIQKVSQYLFANLPTVMTAAQRVVNAYKVADYRELGHGTGGVYNLLRTAATA